MRFKAIVEYDGTDYIGWQIQPNGRSIQGILEEAVRSMLGESVRMIAAGRTDAGVHAAGQVVTFELQRAIATEKLLGGLNALTPRDITIRAIEPAADAFDPRRA